MLPRSVGRWRVEEDGRVFGPDNKPARIYDLPGGAVVLDDYRPDHGIPVMFMGGKWKWRMEELRDLDVFLRPVEDLIHG